MPPAGLWSPPKSGQEDVADGVMGNHVAWRRIIDLHLELARTSAPEDMVDPGLVIADDGIVGATRRRGIMLGLPETAVIPPDKDLDLFAATTVRPQHVQVRVPGDPVEPGVKLFPVADGSPVSQKIGRAHV